MVGASPTPSTVSPFPADEDPSTTSAATSPELTRREIPGREDNTRAQDFLNRGPPSPIAEPENHLKAALVHGALTLLRFENAGRVMEEVLFRTALQQVWSDDNITTMKGYRIGTIDADASRREIDGFAEAMGGNLLQPRDKNLEGGAFYAALTAVHLVLAERVELGHQIRQLAATLFNDENVHALMIFHKRNGLPPTAKEERGYVRAMRGEQAPEEEERSDDGGGGQIEVEA